MRRTEGEIGTDVDSDAKYKRVASARSQLDSTSSLRSAGLDSAPRESHRWSSMNSTLRSSGGSVLAGCGGEATDPDIVMVSRRSSGEGSSLSSGSPSLAEKLLGSVSSDIDVSGDKGGVGPIRPNKESISLVI